MHLASIGGGPRAIIQTVGEMAFILAYKQHFDDLIALGAHYNIDTTIIEQQSEFGVGVSFSSPSTGMANTGIEAPLIFPLPPSFPEQHREALLQATDYKLRYNKVFGDQTNAYYEKVKQHNLVGAVMFKRALSEMSHSRKNLLDHSRAYVMRRHVGEEEFQHFCRFKEYAQKEIPFYNLRIRTETRVEKIMLHNSTTPLLKIRQLTGDESSESIKPDILRLNTGTTLANPLQYSSARKHAFCQAMNPTDLARFFHQKALLDKNGKLLPNVNILNGGMSLSALDQLSALDNIMDLFEEDHSQLLGYKVREEAKQKYQGAITYMSRTPGVMCTPRHSHTIEWQQGFPVLGSTEQLHALFLHEHGHLPFQIWIDILDAAIARATYRTPDNVDPTNLSTEEIMTMQQSENEKHLQKIRDAGIAEQNGNFLDKKCKLKQSTRTLYGAHRQAMVSLMMGFGLEEDLNSAVKRMESYAPLTWKGRQKYLMARAQHFCLTHPDTAPFNSSQPLVDNWNRAFRHMTASPVEIHSMFYLLYEAGIAQYVPASYSDITVDSTGKYLKLNDNFYDALVVSPIFKRNANTAVLSLQGAVKSMHEKEPRYSDIAKFRRVVSVDNKPLPIEDNGLSGRGFTITAEDGKKSTVGVFAWDSNHRESAVLSAASITTRRMAMAHLSAAGVENPMEVLDDIYEQNKPTVSEYDAEVSKFKEHFESAFEIWAFVKAVAKAANDNATRFAELYDRGLSRKGRTGEMQRMANSRQGIEREAASEYFQIVENTPVFAPASRDKYLNRFVDTTPTEDRDTYYGAIAYAKEYLRNSHTVEENTC